MIQLAAAVAALNAFVEATANKVVTPDEGQRRANICIVCPKRRKISTLSLSNVARLLGARANKNRVPSYDAAVVGIPQRMRDWNRRQKQLRNQQGS